MDKFILVIDQGTTSSRAILFNKGGLPVAITQKELPVTYPQPGYVEVDANELFAGVVDCIIDVLKKANIKYSDVDSIGITNQRETTVVWSSVTGLPVCNAIVWQSRQSQQICDALSDKKELLHKKTGLIINPYFSASKIRYILDHISDGQERAEKGELLFGTVDSWLIYKMTNGRNHATDTTNASRTLLFNINTNDWDDELLNLFNIPKKMLPKVYPCNHDYGTASMLNKNVHITGVIGDQQAALFGQNCFKKGESKSTYGTGCFMLMNIGEKPILSKNGLLTTVAWNLNGKLSYAFEGSVFVCGTAIKWLRDSMGLIKSAPEINELALQVKDTGGVYFVPAFVGLGTPYWENDTRGTFFGISASTNPCHIALATLEAIAFQCKDVFSVMEEESKIKIPCLYVDGGVANSEPMLQFESNILGIPVSRPQCLESTALGAAYMAGLTTGFFESMKEISKVHCIDKSYYPTMSKEEAEKRYKGWKSAVKSAISFRNE